MPRYATERKEALLKKLLPPINMSVAELARQEGISEPTLYHWRNQAKASGVAVPGDKKLTKDWPAEARFAVVVETATLSEIDLGEYCRRKGVYPEDVRAWRQACIDGQQSSCERRHAERVQTQSDQKRIKELERELKRKEKALAEAAAILVLRKKLHAWLEGDNEVE